MDATDDQKVRAVYGRRLGLPAEQVRYFDELTEDQVNQVRYEFSAGLAGVHAWIYGVTRDGRLVRNRERRDPRVEMEGFWR